MKNSIRKKQDHFEETICDPANDIFARPAYKTYRRRWVEYPTKRLTSPFPMNLDICVTNRCNLRCVMCRRTQKIGKGFFGEERGDMEFSVYKRIIDEASREGAYAVHLSGNGEPLMHKDIINMIRYARKKKILDIFMHTNGTLLHEDTARRLLDAGLTRLIISIDSSVKETYEKVRVGAHFDTVINNIKTFMRLKRSGGRRYPFVRVQMVEMNLNHGERRRYDAFFKKIVDSIGHIEYINYNKLDSVNRYYRPRVYKESYVCKQLWQRLCVNYDGNIYGCLIIDRHSLLGNVRKTSIKKVWLGRKMKRLRRAHCEGRISHVLPCRNCGYQLESVVGEKT